MRRAAIRLTRLLAVLALSLSPHIAWAEAVVPQKLLVRVRVLQTPAENAKGNAATRVLAAPTLLISAGQSGSIHVGTEIPQPNFARDFEPVKDDSNSLIAVGTQVEIRAGQPRDGKVQLDLSLDVTERIPSANDRIDIRRYGVRTVGQFKFGESIRVAGLKTSERDSTWMEIMVEPVSE